MSSSQMNLRKRLPVWTGAFAVSVGVLVIAGWHFEILLLTRVFLGFRDMAPITAFCFMLAGASLALLGNPESKKEWRIIGQFLAAAVFTVGLVVASEYLFPSGIWIETFVDRKSVV